MDRTGDRPALNLSNGGRGLPENPAQGRRNMTNGGGSLNSLPPMPTAIPANARSMSSTSSSTLSANPPVSAGQVIGMARRAMAEALKEHESQAAEASGVSNELKPGVTIDLSRKNIQELPEEIVDVIKHELERLALSHNKISSFPARWSECSSLRYLNVRNNELREFPLPLCHLKSLEILDLGRNKIKSLPPEIVKLTSLKVFAVQKNRIEELPICLADMGSLQMIKLEGNPIRFPPPEVLQVQATSPPNEGHLKESEVTELTVTAHIKKFMKQRALEINTSSRSDSEMGMDDSNEGMETPRVPIKRVVSGRFPVRVNGAGLPDLRSPALARSGPPPIPTRSHYRGLSQQNTAPRKPGVMPLTIGNVNERMRSNSETLSQTPRADRPGERSRRMGVVSQKAQQLGTLDETQANNRFSHYRGLSHGSAMQGNGQMLNGKMPVSPAESILQRPIYVRRLSILPERRRESKFVDPVLEAAKGVLYSIFQIHPMIQMLMGLTSDGLAKRSSLEIVFYNTNSHVEELEQEIQRHEADEDGASQFENESVMRACITLVNAYVHVCSLLASNVDLFIDNGDPRYIRTLMMQLYNSITELRVTTSHVLPEEGHRRAASRTAMNSGTIRPRSRENTATPTAERPNGIPRSAARGNLTHNPSNLRVTTDVPLSSVPYVNGTGRTATISSATPRSGESFVSTGSRGLLGDFTEEDRIFENIFLALQKSTDLVVRLLPAFNHQYTNGLQAAIQHRNTRESQMWKALISKCSMTIQQTEKLKTRLSLIKLKEPGIRTQGSFWNDVRDFVDSWAEFGSKVREVEKPLSLPADTRMRLRPFQKSIQEASNLILRSPWGYWLRPGLATSHQNANGGSIFSPGGAVDPHGPAGLNGDRQYQQNGQYGNPSHNHLHHNPHIQLPMTPQSAALGPAAQATVPATPQSGSFAAALTGNVFERADALMSQGGPSSIHSHSRHGTFTSSTSGSSGGMSGSFNSINSTLSSATSYNDDRMGGHSASSSSSVISPGGLGGGPGPMASAFPFRMQNGGGRVAL
ncbi:uncharacterized protein PpBr36_06363 [Pyricularia pennisetigena]|uniref:uncharacterized protein n=1 Tax=Pyricularia pennisetigena TaxID=1578925 RepID=UPI00114F1EEB|nr:uncharacterized protein PpBr36_06363 [Pyricularia pennisetigena]TLS22974.1 hypothetical protein PpBr36_06363 [Pyricularia pennisetigena]